MKNLGIKVLHVSHELLDIKTERVAHTNVKYGCKVFFAGPYRDAPWGFNTALFHRLYEVKFDRATIVGVPHKVAKIEEKIRGIVKECKPDLIHAHNVFAARLVMDLGLPFVYDAHEFWSERARVSNRLRHYYRRLIWPLWEREVLKNAHAVITVSDTIAEHFRKFNDNVFVVPNFPRLVEVEHLKPKKDPNEFSSVTVGKFSYEESPKRSVEGFLDLFRKYDLGKLVVIGDANLKTSPPIYSKGYLYHDQFLEELTHHYLGIIPFKKHRYHAYACPTKAFEYVHAGLPVVLCSDYQYAIQILKDVALPFDDYRELVEIIRYYKDNKEEAAELGIKALNLARRNFTWDLYEQNLIKAYEIALKQH